MCAVQHWYSASQAILSMHRDAVSLHHKVCYAELLTAHTRPFARLASCMVLRMGCDVSFTQLNDATCVS